DESGIRACLFSRAFEDVYNNKLNALYGLQTLANSSYSRDYVDTFMACNPGNRTRKKLAGHNSIYIVPAID
ncbi:hypothetical protein, partial [Escherichia coli]|uniref:hypothetical protein n=1 Tax=Escherichia coli TaxID=562 RepID=UPI001BB47D3E